MTQTDPTSQKNDSPKTLSARAVAKRLDCGPDYVGKLCRNGKLAGQRVDGAWLVSEESVRRYQGARELARKARSESLSSLRRRENEQFRKLVNPPLREALRKVLYSAPFAVSVFALCAVLVFAGTFSSPYLTGDRYTESEQGQTAALAHVESPFFGTQPVALDFSSGFGSVVRDAVANFFAFLFGGRPENLAQAPEPQEPQPISPSVPQQPQVPGSPSSQTVVHNTYPVVERVVESTTSGNWVSVDLLTIILGEFRTELTRVIGDSIGGSVEKISTGGGGLSLSDLTDANIPDTLTVSGYLPLSGGTLTGQLISTSVATTTLSMGVDISDGCFAVDGVCITGGGGGGTIDGSGGANLFAYWVDSDTLAASSSPYFSTATFGSASTTNFALTGITSSLLKTNADGTVVAAVVDVDYASAGSTAFPFTPQTWGNSTSTIIGFTQGLISNASSTFTSTLNFTNFTNGSLAVNSSGGVYTAATTTFSGALAYASGDVTCNTADASTFGCLAAADWTTFNNKVSSSSLSQIFPFTPTSIGNSTSTLLQFTQGFISNASSTITALNVGNSTTTNATTTTLGITGITSSLLKTTSAGAVVPAVAGTDYLTSTNIFAFPFTPTTAFGTAANATSTLIGFTAGLYSTASSTIGSGTQAGGLTISGGATTTGNSLVQGSQTIDGSLTLGTDLAVAQGGTGLSTFGGTNTVLYTTAADTLASEAALTYDASANRLTFDYASTTALSATTICLTTDCRTSWPSGSGAFSWTPTTAFGSAANATSTLIGFTQGLYATASSTILSLTTVNSTTTNATTTNLYISGALTFGGVSGSVWTDFCQSITGGAGLCDGTDNTGGGSGLATSTDIADTYVIYGTSADDVGAEAAFTYDDATNKLTVDFASTTGFSSGYASSTLATFGTATVGGTLTLSSLSNSGLAVNSTGAVYAAATTTFSGALAYASGAVTCNTADASTFGCLAAADWTTFNNKVSSSSLSQIFPFTPGVYSTTVVNATSTALQLQGGLFASSTVRFGNAGISPFFYDGAVGNVGVGTTSPFATLSVFGQSGSTNQTLFAIGSTTSGFSTSTLFSVSNIGSTTLYQIPSSLLKTNANGTIVGAVAGTDYLTSTNIFAFPWTPTTAFGTAANATSTLIGFTAGLYSTASSTIGSGTQAGGLTINGGATTTGFLTVLGNSTSTFSSGLNAFAINTTGSATSTFTNGLSIADGCFAVDGACLDLGDTPAAGNNTEVQYNSSGAFAGSSDFTFNASASRLTVSYASTTAVTVSGTASTTNLTVSAVGNALLSTSNGGVVGATTVSAPLSFAGTTLSISQSGSGSDGYLSSTDWNVFNNKIASTSLSGASVISYNSSTGVITTQAGTFGGSASSVYTFPGDLIITGNSTTTNATTTNLYVDATVRGAGLSACSGSTDKLLWNTATGQFSCGNDAGASGTTEINWTFFNNSGVRVSTSTNQVLIGHTSTSTLSKLEVVGGATFDSATTTAFRAEGVATFGGNVGLGTTSPYQKLSVVGGTILQTASGNPTLASTTTIGGTTYASYVSGRYAYVAANASGLKVVDIYNPASPAVVGTYSGISTARDVVVAGRYAYVADFNTGLHIIDVSNPASPVLVGSYSIGGQSSSLALSGKYVFINDFNNAAVRIIDVSNPAAPVLTGSYTGTNPNGVAVSGKYLYVADFAPAVNIVDISNPATPVQVGSYSTNLDSPHSVYVTGRVAYVADGATGLHVLNVGNPAAPTLYNQYPPTGSASYYDVEAAGGYAYVAENASGNLVVLDVSRTSTTTLVGQLDTGTAAQDVFVAGTRVLVANQDTTVSIVNINGTQVPTAHIGALETDRLSVTENINAGGDIYAGGGLDVGISGIFSRGTISAFIASTTQTNPVVANFMGGNVGIGTTSPYARLSVEGASALGNSATAGYFTATTSTASTFPYASTTAITVSGTASTTNLTISSIASGSLLKTTTAGSVIAAIAGTDYVTSANLFAFPFTPTSIGNSTSTLIQFTAGLISNASSTIGSGTQAGGLTINGGATTTGFLTVQGSATSTFSAGVQTTALNVTTGTSTFGNGITLADGCFAVDGTCIFSGASAVTAIGPANQTADGPTVTLATSTAAFNGLTSVLTITGSGDTLTFAPTLSGSLGDGGIDDAITVSGGTIGSNTISSGSTWTTTGSLTIGDGGDTINIASDSWDVTSGAFSGITTLTASGLVTSGSLTTGNASTTNLSANTAAFGGTGTTSVSSTGALTIQSLTGLLKATSGLVSVATAGTDYLTSATTFAFPFTPTASGNSTSTTLIFGNGFISQASSTLTGNATTTGMHSVGSLFINSERFTDLTDGTILSNVGGVLTATITGGDGITVTANDIDCDTANSTTFGCLAAADWTTFNNKVSSSSLSQIFPFTPTTNFGAVANSTSTALFLTAGLQASSTVRFGDAGVASQFLYTGSTGFMSLGSTSPWGQFSINPTGTNGAAPSFVIGSSTATNFVVTNAGNVGIGTASPVYKLTVNFNDSNTILAAAGTQVGLNLQNTDTTTNNWTMISNNTSGGLAGAISFQNINHASAYSDISFATRGASGWGERVRVTSTGNVGIGTTSPYARLSVEGASALGNSATAGFFTATTTTASTFPYASTTAITVSGTASTTALRISGTQTFENLSSSGLAVNSAGAVYAAATTTFSGALAYASGAVTCNTADASTFGCLAAADWSTFNNKVSSSSLSSIFPFTPTSIGNSTSTLLQFTAGFISNASSTITALNVGNSTTTNATTTSLAITGITSTLLKTTTAGSVIAAVLGTDYQNFAYLFPSNATSTELAFNGGLTAAGATSTALAVTGSTTLSSQLNAVGGATFNNATVGGTLTLSSLSNSGLAVNSTGAVYAAATTTFSGALAYASGNVTCNTADASTFGCLAAADWSTFNNKVSSSSLSSIFPFTPTTAFGTAANATSTLIGFTAGLYSLASSTIGDGSQTGGLTISGGATTTGNSRVVGTSLLSGAITTGSTLSVAGNVTLTSGFVVGASFGSGIVLRSGQSGSSSSGAGVTLTSGAGVTTGTKLVDISGGGFSFFPTSGTGTFTNLEVGGFSINQTGSASGITRGQHIIPTVTVAVDYRAFEVAGYTQNIARNMTTAYGALLNQFILASTSASTVTDAYGFTIGAPVAASNVTVTTSAGLYIPATTTIVGTGAVTNAYGILANAPTGATNNFAAAFLGGNVGVGTSSPYAALSVVGQVAGAYFTATTTTASQFPYASSTAITVSGTGYFGTASTTNLRISGTQTFENLTNSGLAVNSTGAVYAAATTTFSGALAYASGAVTCNTADASTFGCLASADWSTFNNKVSSSSLSQIFPFTPTTNYGVNTSATSTPLWARAALFASSTSQFDQINVGSTTLSTLATSTFFGNLSVRGTASTTALTISGITSGSLLKTTTAGSVIAAVLGTDYQNFAYLFPSNATSTELAFNGGLTAAGATSTALAVTGSTTLSSQLNAVGGATFNNATVGGTLTLSSLSNSGLAVNSTGAVYAAATTTFSGALAYASGNVTCNTADAGSFGCLASADWSTFNNKVSSSSLSSIFPFTPTTAFGTAANSTSTPIWFQAGLQSSSTAQVVDLNLYGIFNFATTTTSTTTLAKLNNEYFITAATSTSGLLTVGYQAGQALLATTSASGNTVFGYQALMTATSSRSQTAFGYQALKNTLDYGTFANTAVGYQALTLNTTGENNVAVGHAALNVNVTGSENTAIGFEALQQNITGTRNVAIGKQAGEQNMSATSSVFIGFRAGFGNSNPYSSQGVTIIGTLAGSKVQTGSDYNTLVGYQAGEEITTGYANIILGAHVAGTANLTSGSGNIGIGNELFFPSATANNQLNIGNFLYGTLPATSTAFSLPTSGALGVGTSSPYAMLSIHANNGETNTTLFAIASSTGSATTTHFVVTNSGNVRIGTTSETIFGITYKVAIDVGDELVDGLGVFGTNYPTLGARSNTSSGGQLGLSSNTAKHFLYVQGDDLRFYNDDLGDVGAFTYTGNFGIGTTTPWGLLSVNPNGISGPSFVIGSSTATKFIVDNGGRVAIGTSTTVLDTNSLFTIDRGAGNIIRLPGSNGDFEYTGGSDGIFWFTNSGIATGKTEFTYGSTRILSIMNSGNVGIGTTTPYSKLSVWGANTTAGVRAFEVTNSASTTVFMVDNAGNASTTALTISGLNAASCDVKSSTTGVLSCGADSEGSGAFAWTPTTAFGAAANATSTLIGFTAGLYSLASSTIGAGGQTTGLTVSGGATTTGNAYFGGNVGIGTTTPWAKLSINNSTGDTAGQPLFAVASSTATATTTAFIITNSGNVGIGTTSPFSLLSVQGAGSTNSSYLLNLNSTDTGGPQILFGGSGTYDGRSWSITAGGSTNSALGAGKFGIFDRTAAAVRFAIDSSGNVGIGTTTPQGLLQVGAYGTGGYGESNVALVANNNGEVLGLTGGSTFSNINFYLEGTTTRMAAIQSVKGGTGEGGELRFFTSSDPGTITQRVVIDEAGNVGIGETAPGSKLSVSGGGSFGAGYDTTAAPTNGLIIEGNVGIGTTSPWQVLSVDGNAFATGEIISNKESGFAQFRAVGGSYGVIHRNDGSNYYTLLTASGDQYGTWNSLRPYILNLSTGDTTIGNTTALTVKHAGNVGIGTTSPSRKLSVTDAVSTAQQMLAYDTSNFATLLVNATGDLVITTSGGDITLSDDNLFVCQGGSCPTTTATSTAGNLFVENAIHIGSGWSLRQIDADELGLYDVGGSLMVIFDEGT